MKRLTWVLLILILCLCQEGDCRRKILKGRKAITRTYFRNSAVPSWAIVVLVGLAELILGVLLFLPLKFLLDRAGKPQYIHTTLVSSP